VRRRLREAAPRLRRASAGASGALREATLRLRRRPRRALLAALGVFAAATMLGAAVSVSYGLATGYGRAATRADLPDVIARFEDQPLARVRARVEALPDLAAVSYRQELLHVPLSATGHTTGSGALELLRGGRRGYAVVAGRDLPATGLSVLVERGLARSWRLHVGDRLRIGQLGDVPIAGIVVAPDDVAYPLATAAHVYLSQSALAARLRFDPAPRVNVAQLWLRNRRYGDIVLAQARATSAGVAGLTFVTRSGVEVLIDQAGGIVIALLVAVSLVALAAAAVMLAASWRAEVQRRLPSIGVRRALGFSRAHVAALHGFEAALVGAPAAAVGLAFGALLAGGPSARLLEALNELPPGAALLGPLALTWLGVVLLVAAAATWPAWRAAGRGPVALLRGGDVAARVRGGYGAVRGPLGLGARLVAARRARLVATIAVLAVSAGFVLLLLSLASLLDRLEHDPGSVGKRYQLTARLGAGDVGRVERIPGVAAAAPRLVVQGADSYALGETVKLVAYPGDHTRFEAPPLTSGRHQRRTDEAEVGQGLAQALGLGVGSTLAVALPGGGEARWRVVGVVRALDNDGRIAYVRPERLLAAGFAPAATLAVRLSPGASRDAVARRLASIAGDASAVSSAVGGATSSAAPFLGAVAALVRAIAAVDAVVCFFALAQALALSARERRATVALLRAIGAGRTTIARLFVGAALVLVVPAALLGVLIERLLLGPAVARLAAGYAALSLGATLGQALGVAAGLLVLAALAALWAARRAERESIPEALRQG
jgi:ABC-type lipoprotein release transport system permease subunit